MPDLVIEQTPEQALARILFVLGGISREDAKIRARVILSMLVDEGFDVTPTP